MAWFQYGEGRSEMPVEFMVHDSNGFGTCLLMNCRFAMVFGEHAFVKEGEVRVCSKAR